MPDAFFDVSADGATLAWRPHPFTSVVEAIIPLATLEPIVVSPAGGAIATRNTYDTLEWSASGWNELSLRDHRELVRASAGLLPWTDIRDSVAEIRGIHRDGSRWNQVVRRPDPPMPDVKVAVIDDTLHVTVERLAGWTVRQFALKTILQAQDTGAPVMRAPDAAEAQATNGGLRWTVPLRNARGVFALVLTGAGGVRVLACARAVNGRTDRLAANRQQLETKFTRELAAVETRRPSSRNWRDSWPRETTQRVAAAVAAVSDQFGNRLASQGNDMSADDMAALFRVYLLLIAGAKNFDPVDLAPFRKGDFRQTVQSLFSLPAEAMREGIPPESFLTVLIHARDPLLSRACEIAPPMSEAPVLERAFAVVPIYEKAQRLRDRLADGQPKTDIERVLEAIREHARTGADVAKLVDIVNTTDAIATKEESTEPDPNDPPPISAVALSRWRVLGSAQRKSRIALFRVITLCETGSFAGGCPPDPAPHDMRNRIDRLVRPEVADPPALQPDNQFRQAAEAALKVLCHEKLDELQRAAAPWVRMVFDSAPAWQEAHAQIASAEALVPSLPWIAERVGYPWTDLSPRERYAHAVKLHRLYGIAKEQMGSAAPGAQTDDVLSAVSTPGHAFGEARRAELAQLIAEAGEIYSERFVLPAATWEAASAEAALRQWGNYLLQLESQSSALKRRLENTRAAVRSVVALFGEPVLNRIATAAEPQLPQVAAAARRVLELPDDLRAQVALLRILVIHEEWRRLVA